MEEVLVELDERRRASLGKVGQKRHQRYLATTYPDGTVVLTPAVLMSEIEARVLGNQELIEEIAANRKDPSRLEPLRRRQRS